MHTGGGVARREAYRAKEQEQLEEVDVAGLLATERERTNVIVRVAAGSVVVETEGPNYVPAVTE